jgi:hypothetical protein
MGLLENLEELNISYNNLTLVFLLAIFVISFNSLERSSTCCTTSRQL